MLIFELFKPVTDLIDTLHTSEEEKAVLRNQAEKTKMQLQSQILDYESKLMDSQASIARAEAQGQSWLQRNWRPITMLTFLVLVVCDVFGFLAFRLASDAWTLLQLGLGGYVVGRSAEKVASVMKKGK